MDGVIHYGSFICHAGNKCSTFFLVWLVELLSFDILMNSGFRVKSTSRSAFATSRTNASTAEPFSTTAPPTGGSHHNEN